MLEFTAFKTIDLSFFSSLSAYCKTEPSYLTASRTIFLFFFIQSAANLIAKPFSFTNFKRNLVSDQKFLSANLRDLLFCFTA